MGVKIPLHEERKTKNRKRHLLELKNEAILFCPKGSEERKKSRKSKHNFRNNNIFASGKPKRNQLLDIQQKANTGRIKSILVEVRNRVPHFFADEDSLAA